jgi:hypothetical protein
LCWSRNEVPNLKTKDVMYAAWSGLLHTSGIHDKRVWSNSGIIISKGRLSYDVNWDRTWSSVVRRQCLITWAITWPYRLYNAKYGAITTGEEVKDLENINLKKTVKNTKLEYPLKIQNSTSESNWVRQYSITAIPTCSVMKG